MDMKLGTLVLGLSCFGPCQAQEPAVCRDPALPGLDQSADNLRQTATGCLDKEIADLDYNRAYFKDLQTSLASMSRLSVKGSTKGRLSRDAFQTYILFSELIARERISDPLARAPHLNQGYEQALEVAEMRLKGL